MFRCLYIILSEFLIMYAEVIILIKMKSLYGLLIEKINIRVLIDGFSVFLLML